MLIYTQSTFLKTREHTPSLDYKPLIRCRRPVSNNNYNCNPFSPHFVRRMCTTTRGGLSIYYIKGTPSFLSSTRCQVLEVLYFN